MLPASLPVRFVSYIPLSWISPHQNERFTTQKATAPTRRVFLWLFTFTYCTTIGNSCSVVVTCLSRHRSLRSSKLRKTWQSNQSQCTIGFCHVSFLLFCWIAVYNYWSYLYATRVIRGSISRRPRIPLNLLEARGDLRSEACFAWNSPNGRVKQTMKGKSKARLVIRYNSWLRMQAIN